MDVKKIKQLAQQDYGRHMSPAFGVFCFCLFFSFRLNEC